MKHDDVGRTELGNTWDKKKETVLMPQEEHMTQLIQRKRNRVLFTEDWA